MSLSVFRSSPTPRGQCCAPIALVRNEKKRRERVSEPESEWPSIEVPRRSEFGIGIGCQERSDDSSTATSSTSVNHIISHTSRESKREARLQARSHSNSNSNTTRNGTRTRRVVRGNWNIGDIEISHAAVCLERLGGIWIRKERPGQERTPILFGWRLGFRSCLEVVTWCFCQSRLLFAISICHLTLPTLALQLALPGSPHFHSSLG